MTRKATTSFPALDSIEQAHNPAGLTAKATTQKTHGPTCRGQLDAQPNTSDVSVGSQFRARVSEDCPPPPPVDSPQEFRSPFEAIKVGTMADDERSQAERILNAISHFCAYVAIAGVLTLFFVNMISPGLSPGSECGPGLHNLSQLEAGAELFPASMKGGKIHE